MRLRFLIPAVALVATAGSAQAGIGDLFKKPSSLPAPISNVAERVERSAVATQIGIVRHPPKEYSGSDWGSRFDQIKHNYPPRPMSPFLRGSEH
jgi:hypothetical protein